MAAKDSLGLSTNRDLLYSKLRFHPWGKNVDKMRGVKRGGYPRNIGLTQQATAD